MNQLFLDFFFRKNNEEPYTNDEIIPIRDAMTTMMQNANFGSKQENYGHFANEYAIPLVDSPQRNIPSRLYFSYAFLFPLIHGDLAYVMNDGILFLNEIAERYDLTFTMSCSYEPG